MKKQYLLLLLLPVCFIIFSLSLRSAEGPYYNGLADPSYVYLINSLSLAQMNGYNIGHVDHPGTPLQITGAVVVKIFYTFSNGKNNIAEDVLARPEVYMNAIDFALIILNAAGLFIMGLIIYNVRKNYFTAMFFQTVPFVSVNMLEVFSLVKPENFAFFIIVILLALMVKIVYDPPENYNRFLILSGVLCGMIMAAKISFICILLIPLLIFPGIKKKLLFIAAASGSFLIFVLPAVSNTNYFIDWVGKLILHEDRYGKGDDAILNTGSFLQNIAKIYNNERFFAVVYFLILAVLALSLIWNKKSTEKVSSNSFELKFLFAIFFSMSVHVALVAKHYSQRYMFPALILTAPGLYISVLILYKKYLSKINANIVFGILFMFTFVFGAYNSRKILAKTKTRVNETVKLNNFINANYPGTDIILSSGASGEFTGLLLAYFYSGENVKEVYKKIIISRYPNVTSYDMFNDKIFSLTDSFEAIDKFKSGKTVLFQTMDSGYNNSFLENIQSNYDLRNVKLTEVFSNNNGEQLYKLEVKGN